MTLARLLGLVVALNIVRYVVAAPIEGYVVFDRLFSAMEASVCFNTMFTTFDWVTSYFYNFMMWFSITLFFYVAEGQLTGGYVLRSLKLYAIAWLFFASVSAIYMNHYSHPKDFYAFNVLDALLVFPVVAVANGLLYPRFGLARG